MDDTRTTERRKVLDRMTARLIETWEDRTLTPTERRERMRVEWEEGRMRARALECPETG